MAQSETGGDAPSPFQFSPQDALAFLQRMWNPLGVPMPGFGLPDTAAQSSGGLPFPNPAMMFAALDPVEIERKIVELQVIENWLSMSLNMMQMSIKTLELQKASLEAIAASQQSTRQPGKPAPRPKPRKE
jgi:hypothetical protein